MFEYEDIIVLSSGHSLMGRTPLVKGEKDGEPSLQTFKYNTEKVNPERFGLFDSSSPNYTTFYPDAKVEDFTPKAEDFIYPVFRLISAGIVHRTWNPIDFSEGSVLKDSIPLLIGQTINVDHEMALGNAIGAVKEAVWSEGYTVNGLKVPAGIDGTLMIDGKSNPRLARGINSNPPSIHSNSVTIRFKWKKSHEGEDDASFWSKLGTYDKDGNLYRRIATKIMGYLETSLVNHGADPFAKKHDNSGKIVLPAHVKALESFVDKTQHEKNGINYIISYKGEEDVESFSSIPTNTNKIQIEEMKEALTAMAALYGLVGFTGETAEQFKEALDAKIAKDHPDQSAELQSKDTKIQELQAEVENLKKQEPPKPEEDVQLKADASVGQEAKTAMLQRGKEVLAKLHAKSPETITAQTEVLEGISKFSALKTMVESYEAQLEEKFPMCCADCNSTNVSRASRVEDKGDAGNNKPAPKAHVVDTQKEVVKNSRGGRSLFRRSEKTV